jgi:hypothetical protein
MRLLESESAIMRPASIAMTSVVLLLASCGSESTGPILQEAGSVGSEIASSTACPDPKDPKVHYVSDQVSTCAAALFSCSQTQTTFNDACGCGCIDQPAVSACPDPKDPKVHYISDQPLKCAAAFFMCSQAQTTFNDACGCGCVD